MSFSLYEVEITAKRAVRGAGYDWGTAEEAAWAVRWLTRHGLPGAEVLARHLSNPDAPGTDPLIAGPALTDRAGAMPGGVVELRNPLLFLPFVAAAAQISAKTVVMDGPGLRCVTDGTGLTLTIDGDTGTTTGPVSLSTTTETPTDVEPAITASVDPAAWASLQALGHRTFAPATEESRMRGAGESA